MANMNFSQFQIAIFNEVKNGTGNLAINAVAGSGKTTTIVECCKLLHLNKYDVKFLAFNKSIVEELSVKIGNYADVSTLHSFGFNVIKKINKRAKVNNRKYSNIIRDMVDSNNKNFVAIVNNASKLFNLCRVNLIKADNITAINSICDEHSIVVLDNEISIVNSLLKDCYILDNDNPEVDFTDMLVLPLAYRRHIPAYKFVFIDECQDLNAAQRELMLAAATKGRFIAVGDRNQAINGFAGADCNSFDKIATLPNTKELPLSVNYRCGKSMIALAQQIVPQIQAHDKAIEGVVAHTNEITLDLFKANDMVLCRSTAPLVAMCLKLIQAGVTAIVKGRDIADGLINTIEKSKAKTIKGFESWVEIEKAKVVKDICKKDNITPAEAEETGRYIAFMDRMNCILTIGENVSKLDDVKAYIQQIFSDDKINNAVTLSTAHKSKGLESDRVVILLPEKLPLTWKHQLEWQYQQELNLKYVALTRAKKELVFADTSLADLLKVKFNNK
jgi:superfamily I DNA/RNA helicase